MKLHSESVSLPQFFFFFLHFKVSPSYSPRKEIQLTRSLSFFYSSKFVCLFYFLAVVGLCCCTCAALVVMRGLLTVVVSLEEHRL